MYLCRREQHVSAAVRPARSTEYVVLVPLACNAERGSPYDPLIRFEGEGVGDAFEDVFARLLRRAGDARPRRHARSRWICTPLRPRRAATRRLAARAEGGGGSRRQGVYRGARGA